MKKNQTHDLSLRERLRKTCLIMKFLVLLLFVSTLHLSAKVYSQEVKVTVSLKNASFSDVVNVLENSTNFTFLYRDHQVAQIKNLNLKYTETDIKVILDACLKGSGLTYRLVDNTIVIQPVLAASTDSIAKITVKGIVKDKNGEILPGVTIRVKGTTLGFVTNVRGEFDFDLPKRDSLELIFSFVGFKRLNIRVKDGMKPLTVVLEEDMQTVDEVVVTGIFNKPKESFTGAVTAVSKEELRAKFSRNLLQTLSNLDPALRIIQNNAEGSNPNALPEIQLRGASTLSDISDLQSTSRAELNTPLFILDGFEISLERMMDLNVEEVENITVLKDASATSLYGSRGANGVVVITTIRPKAGKLTVTYRGEVKVEIPDLTTYNLTNAREKLELERASGVWDEDYLQDAYQALKVAVDGGENFDWKKVPTRTGVGQQHTLNFMGGNDEWRIMANLAYNVVTGVMKGSDRKNFNGSLKVDYTHDKWYVSEMLSVGTNNSENSPYGAFSNYVQMNPYWNPYDDEGKSVYMYYHPLRQDGIRNPMYDQSLGCWNKTKYTNVSNNFMIRYQFTESFRARISLGLSRNIKNADTFKVPSHESYAGEDMKHKGRYDRREGVENKWQVQGGVDYTKTFLDKHMLTVNLNGEMSENVREEVNWAATGFINDDIDHLSTSLGYPANWGTSGNKEVARRLSFIGSVNYYYNMRYFVDLSCRMDGSSSFGEESRWAPFYSIGAGWTVTNEDFMRGLSGWLNNLKFRYSYGVSGNMGFSPEKSMTVYSVDVNQTYLSGLGVKMSAFGNPDLKWQNTYQHNVGIDLGLFSERLSFTFNYYNKLTDNTVSDVLLPISHGFETISGNIGKIRNEGYELNVSLYLLRDNARKINWSVTGRFARQINTIVELSEGLKETIKYQVKTMSGASQYYRYIEGHSMDAIYGLRSLGVNPATGQRVYVNKDGEATFNQSSDDMVYLGDRQPKINGNVNMSFSWNGIYLNVGFGVKWGGKQENFTLLSKGENLELLYNVDRRVLTQAWQKPGDRAMYKGYIVDQSERSNAYTFPCDVFVHKDNVFSCTNLNIGYNFPRELVKRYLGMQSLSVSAQLADVFCLSTIERERGTSYPFSRNPNFSISCTF